jgi:hypothetical protein
MKSSVVASEAPVLSKSEGKQCPGAQVGITSLRLAMKEVLYQMKEKE